MVAVPIRLDQSSTGLLSRIGFVGPLLRVCLRDKLYITILSGSAQGGINVSVGTKPSAILVETGG
jgi:hypothetical protein